MANQNSDPTAYHNFIQDLNEILNTYNINKLGLS